MKAKIIVTIYIIALIHFLGYLYLDLSEKIFDYLGTINTWYSDFYSYIFLILLGCSMSTPFITPTVIYSKLVSHKDHVKTTTYEQSIIWKCTECNLTGDFPVMNKLTGYSCTRCGNDNHDMLGKLRWIIKDGKKQWV